MDWFSRVEQSESREKATVSNNNIIEKCEKPLKAEKDDRYYNYDSSEIESRYKVGDRYTDSRGEVGIIEDWDCGYVLVTFENGSTEKIRI